MQAVIDNVKTIVYALLLAGLFRTLLFQPFWIPSGSMKDTLLVGDFMFVNKLAYGYSRHSCPWSFCPFSGRLMASEPERGDVVVFKHPVSQKDFVKRLVGLPGETVQMKDGVLYINGEQVPQEPDGVFEEIVGRDDRRGGRLRCTELDGNVCSKPRFKETLPGGIEHSVLDHGTSSADTTPVFTIPEGEYFFLGDNRDNSSDSRFPQLRGGVGTVPFENLIGRADRVMFSSSGRSLFFFWTWRGDRFFKAIN